MKKEQIFLFSVDLEEVTYRLSEPHNHIPHVEDTTYEYLAFLEKNQSKATFFCEGITAEKHPGLVADIVSAGHELACHTYYHLPLEEYTPETFRADIEKNLRVLYQSGAGKITGFRAPVCSLTQKTSWVYEILASLGIRYSSSVIPAHNPLYGWDAFGSIPTFKEGILEIPISLTQWPGLKIPFAAGIYFRLLPSAVIHYCFGKTGGPVTGYFHPYDVDTKQDRFMHPGIHNNRLYNLLMYQNRSTVFSKLDRLVQDGCRIIPYESFYQQFCQTQSFCG